MEGNCAPQTHRQVEYIVGPEATSVVTADDRSIIINQENLQEFVAQISRLLEDRQNVLQELLQLLGDKNVRELSRFLDYRQKVLQGLFTEEKKKKKKKKK